MTTLLASPRLRNYEFVPKYFFATGLLVAGRKGLKEESLMEFDRKTVNIAALDVFAD